MEKKVALVTGSSRGIGLAIAKQLLEEGFHVALTATQEERVLKLEKELLQHYPERVKGLVYVANKGSEAAKALIDGVMTAFGRLDCLVNNAGIHDDNLTLRMKDEQWERVIETNLDAPFYLTRAALRPMLKQRAGRILFISSVVGVMGNAGQANYAAAKAGLAGLAKSIAREFGAKGILANVIAPGFVDTDMIQELDKHYLDQIIAEVPLKCLGQAEDIAALTAFLAGEGSKYITGQVIQVDGGLRM